MKVYVSVDMEGIAGITHWDEATATHPDYHQFRILMTKEVLAACEGARAAGATEVYIKDAHDTGRNLLLDELPDYTTVIRGWSGSPMGGLQELDQSFAAIVLIGWHARAGDEHNPLSHTMALKVADVRINGMPVSEFGIYAYLADYCGVPIVFAAGDASLCREVTARNPAITTCAVTRGEGESTISLSPQAARQRIRTGVEQALRGNLSACRTPLPAAFEMDVQYNTPHHAYKFAWYPGAKHIGERTIRFAAPDFFEVKRFLQFVTQ